MKSVEFYKLTAAGNDFVLIDNRKNIILEKYFYILWKKLCDMRYCIGWDWIILL